MNVPKNLLLVMSC